MTPPLPEALKELDYVQLTLHGGRGCFHIAKDGICGRADFWAGHPSFHKFVPLHEAVAEYGQACRTDLLALVIAVHKAKGRYHSQLAMCDLYDACGLPNTRPAK